jgi:hypothetical protein
MKKDSEKVKIPSSDQSQRLTNREMKDSTNGEDHLAVRKVDKNPHREATSPPISFAHQQ